MIILYKIVSNMFRLLYFQTYTPYFITNMTFLKMHHFYISVKHKFNKKEHSKQAIEKWLLKNQY